MATSAVAVSAPGKVLITGGYLVLDPAYRGLVLGTDARFYAIVRAAPASTPTSQSGAAITVHVDAPQFTGARWTYALTASEDIPWRFDDLTAQAVGRNPFVQTVLRLTLAYAARQLSATAWRQKLAEYAQMHVTILGDNDFYSQRQQLATRGLPVSRDALASLPRFCATGSSLRDVHKTGLGSSAALTTALVAALLLCFDVAHPDNPDGRRIAHNLAQACHCYAQGKVGSGFDVSSAVFAGHAYRRFAPAILSEFLAASEDDQQTLISTLINDQDRRWNSVVDAFHLPPGLTLVMADVDAGSHTPSMVSKVLAWRKAHPEAADALWKDLNAHNEHVLELLRALYAHHDADSATYQATLDACRALPAEEWSTLPSSNVIHTLSEIQAAFQNVRMLLRRMGELAGVPVEPVGQTRLLDACQAIPGVVMAGVPGAGGDDAVFCILLSGDKVEQAIASLWSTWTEARVTPLLCAEAADGIRAEDWKQLEPSTSQ
ncbi:ribosomal protein S5 domain 2-type protein [Thamnocephalis sphaerospora]|uniref:Phosphomevalonate kinase n=1 Tax=Thamnocephalis sphaerospora TaxID=78915 RepID=A0A4P9XJ86_9FUNG|nr:ribosomal protein S5 domain 2-type protein [Thamnocephalis sphaerospora]|eukprot:RKP05807.1 ribosomal protein S5 domain 2-type protein [Thamnocephalis sphaerospora]